MFQSLVQKRRSIRKYLSKKVEPEKIEQLIEAALRAPSSRDLKPCRFIVVTESTALAKLARAKTGGSAFLDGAPLAIVVCADTKKSDVWVEDTSIASTYLMLAAESLDLGACWIQIRNRMHNDEITSADYIAELLKVPDYLSILSIIAIGYADETKSPHPVEELGYENVHREKFGSDSTPQGENNV